MVNRKQQIFIKGTFFKMSRCKTYKGLFRHIISYVYVNGTEICMYLLIHICYSLYFAFIPKVYFGTFHLEMEMGRKSSYFNINIVWLKYIRITVTVTMLSKNLTSVIYSYNFNYYTETHSLNLRLCQTRFCFAVRRVFIY